ncbi:MAG: TldD/PmbA family protein [Clostridiales bacterium]|nr:TldD/PmbA family protein [Clostridiales bacterium]
MFEKQKVYDILSEALSFGGDFSEVFIEHNKKNSISFINGKADKIVSGFDYGLGLRIFSGERIIYSYTNDLSYDHLIKMAREASLAANKNDGAVINDFVERDYRGDSNRHKALIIPSDVDRQVIADMLFDASNSAFKYSNLISQTSMGYFDSTQEVLIANSRGLWARDRRVRTRAFVSAVASSKTEKQRGYLGPGALKGLEFYDEIDLNEMAEEAARSAVTMLKADFCPGGKMPVVIDNGFGGVIFHEACGHSLEAATVAKNASVFRDKLGEKIASEKVTAIDDGTIQNEWGSINIDDEGAEGRKNILIENGILKSYIVDQFNGKKLGMSSTGSSRRESYKFAPVSRMTNTYIEKGEDNAEDIISSTDYGIYAKYMGGGSVNPVTGEFNFAVNEAYMIRNGKIAEPVRGATIIGKGTEVLMNIDMVSDNLRLAPGMCGASSGSVPVDVGQPMIRVNNITVGGRG